MNHLQYVLAVLLGTLLPIGIVTSFIEPSELSSGNPDIHLSLVSSCGNSATLYWRHPQLSKLCELTVFETGQLEAQILDIYPDSKNHYIKLNNLHVGQSYSAFIVCDRTTKTSIISFIFGEACEEIEVSNKHHNNTTSADTENATVEVLHSNDFSTVGLLSAVIFSCIAVVLIASVAYFMWKKYQHRQRILRIFRQEQNDPFQALYNPAQDAYSV